MDCQKFVDPPESVTSFAIDPLFNLTILKTEGTIRVNDIHAKNNDALLNKKNGIHFKKNFFH
jgi:hypothetical protein